MILQSGSLRSESLSIVAVGGGSPIKSADLLKVGLDLSGIEKQPNVLVIPTAKTKLESHNTGVSDAKELYEAELGLPVEVLHEFNEMPPMSELFEKFDWADVVYIAGGDTDRMMNVWQQHGVDSLLRTKAMGGLVISGIGEGAIAPFTWGYSDSLGYRVEEEALWDFIAVNALDLIKAAITPHANKTHEEGLREDGFIDTFRTENTKRQLGYGFAIDNQAAIIVRNNLIYSRSQPTSQEGVTVIEARDDSYSTYRLSSDDSIPLSTL